jgi:copper transport protein
MSPRGRAQLAVLAAVAVTLAAPAAAWAHAALLRTSPAASGVVNTPPAQLTLTYSEAVEPRFAIVSVTDAAGRQHTAGRPHRNPTNPDQLVEHLDHMSEGWYLVFWRVVSADGHPVRGAFTFAVGPNPGPAPQFVIPSISETAATPRLLITRWAVFLSLMAAIGLLLMRLVIARPMVRRVTKTSLRATSIAFLVAAAVALISTPIYVLAATAQFALRSMFDLSNVVPLARASAFGRGYLDLEIALALFTVAGSIAIFVDRPQRPARSIAEMLALIGALLAAGAALVVPGLSGHAGQTSPRGLSIALDWLHLAAGSIWIGGLIGLLVVWATLGSERRLKGLAIVVPRFSRLAFVSVMILIASGVWASVLHLPTLSSLWQTSYGKTILVKVALLAAAMLLAAVNLARTKPRLSAVETQPGVAAGAAKLLRALVSGEVVLVAAAIFAAAILSSLPPPAKALATVGKASAHVGPGAVSRDVEKNGYDLHFIVTPNRAAAPNTVRVRIARHGAPVRGADVTATFVMLDMEMGQLAYRLPETTPGVYGRSAPALVMVGHWGLSFDIQPPGAEPFTVLLIDKANG